MIELIDRGRAAQETQLERLSDYRRSASAHTALPRLTSLRASIARLAARRQAQPVPAAVAASEPGAPVCKCTGAPHAA